MEAVALHGSLDQPVYPYSSHFRNPINIHFPIISENVLPSMGLLQAPPPLLYHSYPPFSVQQPPLLPLPSSIPRRGTAGRGLSLPPATRKPNHTSCTRDPSLTQKKSKHAHKSTKKEGKKLLMKPSTSHLGPDPKEPAKDAARVHPPYSVADANMENSGSMKGVGDQVDVFSGSGVFTISPPPSSLPLPTFPLRPKLGCKAEAAGVDSGATDNLRRLLRLRSNA